MCQRCVEDLSDTGRYSYRNADPEELGAEELILGEAETYSQAPADEQAEDAQRNQAE
jgi:hypothetical protein